MIRDKRALDPLEVMLESIDRAQSFVEGLAVGEFCADVRTQHAVAMALVTLGEMSARLIRRNPELVAANPDVPWKNMIGLRNRIAHDYMQVDPKAVWDIITGDLPNLKSRLQPILKALLDRFEAQPTKSKPES